MDTERETDGWPGRRQLIIATLAVMSVLLLVTGFMPAGLFALVFFALATAWVVNWMYGFYRADQEARAQFASSCGRQPSHR